MEEKDPIITPALPNVLTAQQSKKNLYITLGIAAVVLVSVIGYASYLLSVQAEKDAMMQKASLIPTVMPTPTPASPSADFVFYDDLSGEEKFSVASNFSDRVLNAGFAYSPFYVIQAAKADTTRKIADVSFSRSGETVVTVRIIPYAGSKKTFVHDINTQCRKEIDTKNRILFACADGKGMSYIVYLLGANPLEIYVNSQVPKEHASLIRSIISSATNHL